MGKVVASIFGAPEVPEAPVEEEKTQVDPNRDAELAAAAKRRQSIFSRRGRSFLKGAPKTRSGVSFAGAGAATSGGSTKPKGVS